jgi:hypothetical protein
MTGVWLYFTPHLTFHAMKSAAEASDSAALTEHIDFPALKENLKGTFNARFAAEMASHKDAEPFAAAGAMMVAAFINPMIDALVTPESIEQMMSGEKPLQKRDAAGESASSGADDIQTDMACESFDRFVLNVSQKGDTEPIGLVLKREGLFAWKPKAIRLPF